MFVDFDMQQFAVGHSFDPSVVRSHNFFNVASKRVFDISVSLVALICLAPLFLVIAILIKSQSKGPVFFVQKRNGKSGKVFSILKFRSMRHEPAVKFIQCQVSDPRVTKIGHFIRSTSIDELPQLINVLLGQMSIVGPRPHPPELDAKFENAIPFYMERYSMKPGLTGLAQIRGYRGLTPNVAAMADRVSADLEYARKFSLVRDIAIVFKTIPAVLKKTAH